jgi:hypothetical protein
MPIPSPKSKHDYRFAQALAERLFGDCMWHLRREGYDDAKQRVAI